MPHSNPYSDRAEDQPRFQINAKLNLKGIAEFTGVNLIDGPSAGLRVCGIELRFTDLAEADAFAAAAQIMANQLHIAHDRNAVRGTAGPA